MCFASIKPVMQLLFAMKRVMFGGMPPRETAGEPFPILALIIRAPSRAGGDVVT